MRKCVLCVIQSLISVSFLLFQLTLCLIVLGIGNSGKELTKNEIEVTDFGMYVDHTCWCWPGCWIWGWRGRKCGGKR